MWRSSSISRPRTSSVRGSGPHFLRLREVWQARFSGRQEPLAHPGRPIRILTRIGFALIDVLGITMSVSKLKYGCGATELRPFCGGEMEIRPRGDGYVASPIS